MLLEGSEGLPEFLRCAPESTNSEVGSELGALLWKERGCLSTLQHGRMKQRSLHLCTSVSPRRGAPPPRAAAAPPVPSHPASSFDAGQFPPLAPQKLWQTPKRRLGLFQHPILGASSG